jgi:hypothetical protein
VVVTVTVVPTWKPRDLELMGAEEGPVTTADRHPVTRPTWGQRRQQRECGVAAPMQSSSDATITTRWPGCAAATATIVVAVL